MPAQVSLFVALRHCFATAILVLLDLIRLVTISCKARRALAAENLFLRKQLALFQERKVKPRRSGDATRWIMATLSPMFAWRDALWNVKPDTSFGGTGKGFSCSGAGNPHQREDRPCRRACASLSER